MFSFSFLLPCDCFDLTFLSWLQSQQTYKEYVCVYFWVISLKCIWTTDQFSVSAPGWYGYTTPFCFEAGHISTVLHTDVTSTGAGLLLLKDSLNGEHLPHQTAAAACCEGAVTTFSPHTLNVSTFAVAFCWCLLNVCSAPRWYFPTESHVSHVEMSTRKRCWRTSEALTLVISYICPVKRAETVIVRSLLTALVNMYELSCADRATWFSATHRHRHTCCF